MNQEKIENLIEQSKQHNKIAFRQLVEICQPFVYRIAFRLLCNKEEAEDIVQESFIKVYRAKYCHQIQTLQKTEY